MNDHRRKWRPVQNPRTLLRRLINARYPDDDLGPEFDGVDSDRALYGYCKCGLRNPCNSCLPEVASASLAGPGNDLYHVVHSHRDLCLSAPRRPKSKRK